MGMNGERCDNDVKRQVEEDMGRLLKHIVLGSDLRDFSDDLDSILGTVGSEKTVGDFVGEKIAYW